MTEDNSNQERLEALKKILIKDKDYDFSLSGRRIRLIYTDDRYTELKPHDEGTIELIHRHEGSEDQMWVKWDNGSSLMMLVGKDRYEVLE